MFRHEEGARRARMTAMVCTALGMAAMIAAPLARTAAATPNAAPATVVTAPATMPASPPSASSPRRARVSPEAPAWVEAEAFARQGLRLPAATATEVAPRPVTVMLARHVRPPAERVRPVRRRVHLARVAGVPARRGRVRRRDALAARGPDDGAAGRGEHRAPWRAGTRARSTRRAARASWASRSGGIAAVQIAQASTGKYAGLVVIASQVHPDAAQLRNAGVQRVVLAAGRPRHDERPAAAGRPRRSPRRACRRGSSAWAGSATGIPPTWRRGCASRCSGWRAGLAGTRGERRLGQMSAWLFGRARRPCCTRIPKGSCRLRTRKTVGSIGAFRRLSTAGPQASSSSLARGSPWTSASVVCASIAMRRCGSGTS